MPVCPNCGEIVMNGDPYCSNCEFVPKRQTYDKNSINEFKNFYFYAYDGYIRGEYFFSVSALSVVFGTYNHMTRYQKSRVREMLERDWVADLCCITLNTLDSFHDMASEIIKTMDFDVKMCPDCDCIYPARDKFCMRCGKPLVRIEIH